MKKKYFDEILLAIILVAGLTIIYLIGHQTPYFKVGDCYVNSGITVNKIIGIEYKKERYISVWRIGQDTWSDYPISDEINNIDKNSIKVNCETGAYSGD